MHAIIRTTIILNEKKTLKMQISTKKYMKNNSKEDQLLLNIHVSCLE